MVDLKYKIEEDDAIYKRSRTKEEKEKRQGMEEKSQGARHPINFLSIKVSG